MTIRDALRRVPLASLTVFLAMLALYLFTGSDTQLGTDGATREAIAYNILYDHTIVFTQAEDGTIGAPWGEQGVGGRIYAIYGIGQSLMLIPFIVVAQEGLSVMKYLINTDLFPFLALMTVSGALLVALIYRLVTALDYRPSTALKVALLAGFGSILWVLTRQPYDVVQEALGITGAVTFIVTARQAAGWRRRGWLALAGLMWGMALTVRISAGLAAPALLILLLWGNETGWRDRVSSLVSFFVGAAIVGWIVPAYNVARFGSPFVLGYGGHAPYFGAPVIPSAAQWLFSPWRGALVYMPFLCLLPFVWGRFVRRHGWALPAALIVLFVAYLGFYANYSGLGMMGWGPYYLLPPLMLLVVPFAPVFEEWESVIKWQRMAFLALFGLAVFVQLTSVSVPTERYLVDQLAQDQGVLTPEMIWDFEWWPVRQQAVATVRNVANLPDYKRYVEEAPDNTYETMLETFYGFNLPDWWWLARLLRGGISGVLMPPIALAAVLWITAHLTGGSGSNTQENQQSHE